MSKKHLQAEYLNFFYFKPVLENTRLAEQNRWIAICRVAEMMGLDPNSEDDRALMLGILAYKETAVPKIERRRGPKPHVKLKALFDHLQQLEAEGEDPQTIPQLASLLANKFPLSKGYPSTGAAEKQIRKALRGRGSE